MLKVVALVCGIKKQINDVHIADFLVNYNDQKPNSNHPMHNMYANFAKNLEAHKHYAQEFVNERANEQTGGHHKNLNLFPFHPSKYTTIQRKSLFFHQVFIT